MPKPYPEMTEVARVRVLDRHKHHVIDNYETDKLVPAFNLDDGTITFILKGLSRSNEGPVYELAHHLLGKYIPFNITITTDVPQTWFARVNPYDEKYEWGEVQEHASPPSWHNQEHLWRLHQMNRLLDG